MVETTTHNFKLKLLPNYQPFLGTFPRSWKPVTGSAPCQFGTLACRIGTSTGWELRKASSCNARLCSSTTLDRWLTSHVTQIHADLVRGKWLMVTVEENCANSRDNGNNSWPPISLVSQQFGHVGNCICKIWQQHRARSGKPQHWPSFFRHFQRRLYVWCMSVFLPDSMHLENQGDVSQAWTWKFRLYQSLLKMGKWFASCEPSRPIADGITSIHAGVFKLAFQAATAGFLAYGVESTCPILLLRRRCLI